MRTENVEPKKHGKSDKLLSMGR